MDGTDAEKNHMDVKRNREAYQKDTEVTITLLCKEEK